LLGELFDSNDYDVACVLRHSANLSRVLDESEGRMAKGFYYLTMSKQICERIGAVNDENYELTLKMMGAYYRVPVDAEMEYAQTQPKWNKHWKEGKIYVSQYKYGRITEVIKDYTLESIQGITDATCGDLSPQGAPLHALLCSLRVVLRSHITITCQRSDGSCSSNW
jgi:hypothetical protein